jgi:hypothetical protein
VPEEFAAAYWAAYEQALAAQTEGPVHRASPDNEPQSGTNHSGTPQPAETQTAQPDVRVAEPVERDTDELPVRRGPIRIGTHRSEERFADDDDSPTWFERVRDSRWFVPFLLALLAALLILGAYALGRRFAEQVGSDATPDAEPTVVTGEGGAGKGEQPVTNQKPGTGAWAGDVTALKGVRAEAQCTSKPGVDGGGAQVTYAAGNLVDGVADTTWRCDGSAVGERITFDLGGDVPIGQVGLIPGYAKTDEVSKADRFAENNRVTRVRWTIGTTRVVQRMSGSPKDRNLQLLRVPRTTADPVVLEILAVRKGPRDTTAISEVRLGRAG